MDFPTVGGKNYVKYQNHTTYYMHTNEIGSTGSITNHAGAFVEREIYNPWGQRWATSGTVYDERFAHIGKERDLESGLDPTPNRLFYNYLGRWVTPDPAVAGQVPAVAGQGPAGTKAVRLDDPQTWNMYTYARNNPTTLTDPSGLTPPNPQLVGGNPTDEEIAAQRKAEGHANAAQGAVGNEEEQKKERQQEQKAEVGYGETSGLVPEKAAHTSKKASPYDSSTWDPKSTQDLQDARQNIMDVSERNSNVKKDTPSDNPIEQEAWNGNMDAAKKSNGSMPGNYFFIRQAGKGRQRPRKGDGWGQGKPIHSYGPFRNVGGGDVPRGRRTYIDIYGK